MFLSSGASFPAEPFIRRIGDYELQEEIARGGMGIVFRARQVSLDRAVAVKLMRDSALARAEEVKRFQIEAAAAARLKHPSIVTIHEIGQEAGEHFFAMDLIQGVNLAERSRNTPLSVRQSAEIVATIARAVQYAHEQGVLHRDLKPSNVLIDFNGQPFITDFGLARTLDANSSLTRSGQVLGTPGYAPPEQFGGPSCSVGPAVDVYGLGALLFHLLTGRPPFVGESIAEVLQQVTQTPPPPPSLLNPSVPLDLSSLCLKCLEKNPRRRYPSARAVQEDLERWLRGEPTLARPVAPWERLWLWSARNRTLAGSIATVIVVTVVGLAGIVWQWRRAVAARAAMQQAHDERREQLWRSLGQQAHFARLSGLLGQRTNALGAIAAAAAIRPSMELRNDALAALMLPDVGAPLWWKDEPTFNHPWCFDPPLEHYLPHNDFALGQRGRLTVRHSGDHRVVADLGEVPRQPSTAMFSANGRWLAVRLADGDLRVWEWRTGRLITRAECADTAWTRRSFDFSPDSRALYFGDTRGGVSHLDLESGTVGSAVNSGPASIVRISPSGKFLLTTRAREIQVWELDPPRRVVLADSSPFLRLSPLGAAWHPSEELVALGIEGGLFLWHWRSGTQNAFGSEPPAFPFNPVFNRAGDLVFAGGQVWDVATQRRILMLNAQIGSFLALSVDQKRIAFQIERSGFGVWEFLPPLGTRVLMENPFAGGTFSSPDISPHGRWLASVHGDGWRVWNMDDGHILARGPSVQGTDARFTADSKALISVGRDGLRRWPLRISENSDDQARISVGQPETLLGGVASTFTRNTNQPLAPQLRQLTEGSSAKAETGTITAGGRFATLAGNGYAIVADVERTNFFQPIRLLHADVEFRLSPDARWLATGRHNKRWFDVWDVSTGRHVLQVTNPPYPGCQFHPGNGELVSWNQSEMIVRAADLTHEMRRFQWPANSLVAGLLPGGIASSSRALWCSARDGQLVLVDNATGELLARLERPGGFSAISVRLDARGGLACLGTANNTIRLIDLGALRSELAALGLDWPDEDTDQKLRR